MEICRENAQREHQSLLDLIFEFRHSYIAWYQILKEIGGSISLPPYPVIT
jgi:hypothetical protein